MKAKHLHKQIEEELKLLLERFRRTKVSLHKQTLDDQYS